MLQQASTDWLMIMAVAGGLFLLLILVVAVVAAISSKSKGGTGVIIAIVALALLAVPALGLMGVFFFYFAAVGESQSITVPATSQAVPNAVQTRPDEVEENAVDDAAIVKPLEEEQVAEPAGGGS